MDAEILQEDVYQNLLGCRKEEHPAIIRGAQGVKIDVSWDCAGDVIPVCSGKGSAIAKVFEHLGLDAAQAMAFGDSQNDLEMLKAVSVGVAMGNAADEVKAVEDDVCGSVGEDGIFHYCCDHGLI